MPRAYGSMIRDYVASSNTMSPYSKTKSTFRQRFANNNSVLLKRLSATAQTSKARSAATNQQAGLAACSVPPPGSGNTSPVIYPKFQITNYPN